MNHRTWKIRLRNEITNSTINHNTKKKQESINRQNQEVTLNRWTKSSNKPKAGWQNQDQNSNQNRSTWCLSLCHRHKREICDNLLPLMLECKIIYFKLYTIFNHCFSSKPFSVNFSFFRVGNV